MKLSKIVFTQCVRAALLVAVQFSAALCNAHDEQVHERLTLSAANSSENLKAFLRDSLGENNEPFSTSPMLVWYPPPAGTTWPTSGYPPLAWLTRGAYWEDIQTYGTIPKPLRSMDHFYTLLPKPVRGLTDESEPFVVGSWLFPGGIVNSFNWGSEKGVLGPYWGLTSVGQNTETWQDARDYQLAALTSSSKAIRDENTAHMLYALGHVLHLNQDLSQPDHVRNDNHFDKTRLGCCGITESPEEPVWTSEVVGTGSETHSVAGNSGSFSLDKSGTNPGINPDGYNLFLRSKICNPSLQDRTLLISWNINWNNVETGSGTLGALGVVNGELAWIHITTDSESGSDSPINEITIPAGSVTDIEIQIGVALWGGASGSAHVDGSFTIALP